MASDTVIVTGGTGGLGSAIVGDLLAHDWRVVVPWKHAQELDRIDRHDRLELVEADLFDPAAVAGVVELAGDGLRAAVNLVGGFAAAGRVHETPFEDFAAQLRVNLRPTYLVTAAAVERMLATGAGGAIVCVSSRAALRPFAGAAGYVTSKAAVLAFVDALAVEYVDDGIRANAILPSVIDTPVNRVAMPDADVSRWVTPEQIAPVVRFLISADSAPTSGAHVPVYGRA